MKVKELIEKLQQYDSDTIVLMDYGGYMENIDDVYEYDEFIYIG